MQSRTRTLFRIGDILQAGLPEITDIKLMGDTLLCSTEGQLGGVVIEIRVKELAPTDFQEAETLVDEPGSC